MAGKLSSLEISFKSCKVRHLSAETGLEQDEWKVRLMMLNLKRVLVRTKYHDDRHNPVLHS